MCPRGELHQDTANSLRPLRFHNRAERIHNPAAQRDYDRPLVGRDYPACRLASQGGLDQLVHLPGDW